MLKAGPGSPRPCLGNGPCPVQQAEPLVGPGWWVQGCCQSLWRGARVRKGSWMGDPLPGLSSPWCEEQSLTPICRVHSWGGRGFPKARHSGANQNKTLGVGFCLSPAQGKPRDMTCQRPGAGLRGSTEQRYCSEGSRTQLEIILHQWQVAEHSTKLDTFCEYVANLRNNVYQNTDWNLEIDENIWE